MEEDNTMYKIRWVVWALFGLLLLAGCETPTPPPLTVEPPVAPEVSQPVFADCSKLDPARMEEINASGQYFIQDQLIVTGPRSAIDNVLAQVAEKTGTTFELIAEPVDFGHLEKNYLSPEIEPAFLQDPDVRANLEIRLYVAKDGVPLQQAICEIYNAGSEQDVFADPNYIIGPSPFSIGGSPSGGPGAPADPGSFPDQWAFKLAQIGNYRDPGLIETGKGVLVGVFDTSPFTGMMDDRWDVMAGQWDVLRDFEGFQFRVSHPALTMPTIPNTAGYVDVRDHGLFIAGLVHTAAPASDVHLIRVLNDVGRGDLYTLIRALSHFTQRTLAERDGSLGGTVINLSLGVARPGSLSDAGLAETEQWIESLSAQLMVARDLGAVIVAAAGNGSNQGTVEPMEYPAADDFVIGVAAVNPSGYRSCFSDAGDVAAPGGEGGKQCESAAIMTCTGDCDLALISWASQSPTDYAYWAGTSFATALVSGEAALRLERDWNANGGAWPTAATVEAAVYLSAQYIGAPDPCLGYGVVDLVSAMSVNTAGAVPPAPACP
jgi:hypothetical protein